MPICAFDIFPDGTTKVPNDTALTGNGTYRWWHYDLTDPSLPEWARRHLPEIPAGALLQPETRPRCDRFEDGLILNLRGINMNEGSDADQMISVRMWIADDVVITVRRRKVFAVDEIRHRCKEQMPPMTSAAFLETLIEKLTTRVQAHVEFIAGLTDDFENELGEKPIGPTAMLSDTRRSVIRLRRYLEPQRAALTKLAQLEIPLLPQASRLQLRELANRSTMAVEELDALRERLISVQEEHDVNIAQRQAHHGYVLSMAAAIFLPLGFLTGLFGVNVGGMPGINSPWAFAILSLAMIGLAALMYLILKWVRWL